MIKCPSNSPKYFFVFEQLEEFSMDSELESARVKELPVFKSINKVLLYLHGFSFYYYNVLS